MKPDEIEQHLAGVIHESARTVRALLAEDRSVDAVHRLVDRAMQYEAQTKAALVQALARDPRCLPVCAPGCAFCCHLSVFASVPEILRLAKHLRDSLSPAVFAETAARIALAASAFREMSQGERAESKRPCPLLDVEAGRCSAYEARPLACRAYNSCDAGVCERAFDAALTHWDMPVDFFQLTVSRNVRTGLMAGVLAAGLDPGPYELAPGLTVALTHEDAEARWLAGEPVFAEAETTIGRSMRATWRETFERLAGVR